MKHDVCLIPAAKIYFTTGLRGHASIGGNRRVLESHTGRERGPRTSVPSAGTGTNQHDFAGTRE